MENDLSLNKLTLLNNKELGKKLNESIVRGYVKRYKAQLASGQTPDDIYDLPPFKRGRPLLLGDELDQKVVW